MSNEQFQPFKDYVCPGDSQTITVGEFRVTASIAMDDASNPGQYECYDQKEIDAWRQDEWFFGGIVLSVEFRGVTLEKNAASLWGVECNLGQGGNNYLQEIANELLTEALDAARTRLATLRE